ncbi:MULTISPECIES: cytochrome b [Actibacterium]|uniref:Cytochrome b561 n=1 Tax=Actibacterium naphthalenivorans TaxID=1614693 RepID=A0A840C9E2_9RHOB|nr:MULTISPECIES: cytochrome b [Actibacterium]ALG91270.1 hypothetical protein TQ29_15035 [Actibacterium sp. EMB200-NS6]MBB4022644.1 cytochrome b561 [Actibacterium naphthalenivorans]
MCTQATPSTAEQRYSGLAILFHWLTAFLFIVAYVAVYYRIWFTELGTPENLFGIRTHTFAGFSILLIAILRLIWRRVSPPPPHVPGAKIEVFAAKAVHVALYIFMILMPITGYIGLRAPAFPLDQFGLPQFSETALYTIMVTETLGLTWEEFEKPVDALHHFLGKAVVWVFVVIHAAAALFHHLVRRDAVLSRMLPLLRRPER